MKYRVSRQLFCCSCRNRIRDGLIERYGRGCRNATAGAEKAIFCAYCHGSDGNPSTTQRHACRPERRCPAGQMKHRPVMGKHELMIQAFRTGRA